MGQAGHQAPAIAAVAAMGSAHDLKRPGGRIPGRCRVLEALVIIILGLLWWLVSWECAVTVAIVVIFLDLADRHG